MGQDPFDPSVVKVKRVQSRTLMITCVQAIVACQASEIESCASKHRVTSAVGSKCSGQSGRYAPIVRIVRSVLGLLLRTDVDQ